MAKRECAHCNAVSHMKFVAIATQGCDSSPITPITYTQGAAVCSNCNGLNIAFGHIKAWRANRLYLYNESEFPDRYFEPNITNWEPESLNSPATSNLDDVPAEVAGFYLEAKQTQRIKAYRATLMLCRSLIEALAKSKGITKGSLAQKIEEMIEQRHVRPNAKKFLDKIRVLGNGIAHGDLGEVPSEQDAAAIMWLVEYLLDDFYIAESIANRI